MRTTLTLSLQPMRDRVSRPHRVGPQAPRRWVAGSVLALLAMGVVSGLRVATATGQGARPTAGPRAWSPPGTPSPLREIWSFDTKG